MKKIKQESTKELYINEDTYIKGVRIAYANDGMKTEGILIEEENRMEVALLFCPLLGQRIKEEIKRADTFTKAFDEKAIKCVELQERIDELEQLLKQNK